MEGSYAYLDFGQQVRSYQGNREVEDHSEGSTHCFLADEESRRISLCFKEVKKMMTICFLELGCCHMRSTNIDKQIHILFMRFTLGILEEAES